MWWGAWWWWWYGETTTCTLPQNMQRHDRGPASSVAAPVSMTEGAPSGPTPPESIATAVETRNLVKIRFRR